MTAKIKTISDNSKGKRKSIDLSTLDRSALKHLSEIFPLLLNEDGLKGYKTMLYELLYKAGLNRYGTPLDPRTYYNICVNIEEIFPKTFPQDRYFLIPEAFLHIAKKQYTEMQQRNDKLLQLINLTEENLTKIKKPELCTTASTQ